MDILREAQSGTLESNDCMVLVDKYNELIVEIESTVIEEFGDLIDKVVKDTLLQLNITKGLFKVIDKGALDYTIIARVKTAVKRGCRDD